MSANNSVCSCGHSDSYHHSLKGACFAAKCECQEFQNAHVRPRGMTADPSAPASLGHVESMLAILESKVSALADAVTNLAADVAATKENAAAARPRPA